MGEDLTDNPGAGDAGEPAEFQSLESDRNIGTILFLDVKGYSKLGYNEVYMFHEHVMRALYYIAVGQDEAKRSLYTYMNTWGDGLVLVSKDYMHLLGVALEIRNFFRHHDYRAIEVGKMLPLNKVKLSARIAVHFGDFRVAPNLFHDKKLEPYGPAIVLPARIEPITPPNRVWVTDRVKDWVDEEQEQVGKLFDFYPQGTRRLPKDFGERQLFEATHHGEPPAPFDPPGAEAIGEGKAHRIESIIGVNPRNQATKIGFCHQEPKKPCALPSNAVCLAAEFRRVTEVASKEYDVVLIMEELWISLDGLFKANLGRAATQSDCTTLASKIEKFLKLAKKIDRQYKNIEQSGIREFHKMLKVIATQCRNSELQINEGRFNETIPKVADSVTNLKIVYDNLSEYKWECKTCASDTVESCGKKLKDYAEKVIEKIGGSFTSAFVPKYFDGIIGKLPYNNDDSEIPAIWPIPLP